MYRQMTSAILGLFAATPLMSQERWETFHNSMTARQGAFMCSVFDEGTGDFFCLELACEPGGPLAMELSRDGAGLPDQIEASFSVNGVMLSSYPFDQQVESGFSVYRSEAAAADTTLRYWLAQGSNAQVAIGNDIQLISLRGSSAALNNVLTACSVG